jgi:uncharacterized membrane protein
MMDNGYLWIKTIHVFGVVLFLGNIIITGWWKVMADATRNSQIIAFAQRQVTLTDFIFTASGAVILLLAGMANVGIYHMQMSAKWLSQGMLMFTLSGIIWVVVLIPTQIKQARLAKAFAISGIIPDEYWKLCARWNIFGAIAVLLAAINIYWMIFKPA